jgi:hypothetical protein
MKYLSSAMSEPRDRPQTRPTTALQHPGLAVAKRKRRTKAEMEEVRRHEQKEKEDLEKVKVKKLRDLASLEDEISKQDAKESAGTNHYIRPRPRPLTKKVS